MSMVLKALDMAFERWNFSAPLTDLEKTVDEEYGSGGISDREFQEHREFIESESREFTKRFLKG